jgi:hypothetical protein
MRHLAPYGPPAPSVTLISSTTESALAALRPAPWQPTTNYGGDVAVASKRGCTA